MKFSFFVVSVWKDLLKSDQEFKNGWHHHTEVFRKYNVTYFENIMLRGVSQRPPKLTPEKLGMIFPRWKGVANIGPGGSFGEIALLENCARMATIYCSEDCEFAIITKRKEADFEFLMGLEQKALKRFISNFEIFNYWTRQDKHMEIIPYLTKVERKQRGDYIYKAGDPIRSIYLLKAGEVEFFMPNPVKKKNEFRNNQIINRRPSECWGYNHTIKRE
jgi:CRP-like cAMP-binding protein